MDDGWKNKPVTSSESIYAFTWWIRCKISTKRRGHITKKEYGKKKTEIVLFNNVITCSLTTKRRQQRTRGKERKWRHKTDNCGFVETKKRQMSLFYCTVHSIMWTIRNSKALGKKQLLSVGYLIVFWRFGWTGVCYAFPTHHVLWSRWLTLRTLYWPKYCRISYEVNLKSRQDFKSRMSFHCCSVS